jgi:DNA-binding response OmpR family regulator
MSLAVLFVDDEALVRSFVQRGLRTENMMVAVAENGTDGLKLALHESFDVIVLDNAMPDISGTEVCRMLRAQAIRTPILILSALDSVEDKVAALRSGADDYLIKPFDFEELVARIEALCRRSHQIDSGTPTAITIGDITLDTDTIEVFKAGTRVELTAREFQLLLLFFTSEGKVLSRERILNKVWGYDADPLTNVVDVFVRRLRSKLQLDPEAGLIRTVRGYGYKIAVPA